MGGVGHGSKASCWCRPDPSLRRIGAFTSRSATPQSEAPQRAIAAAPRGKHVGTPRTCHATWHNPQTQTEKPHDCATPEISRSDDKTHEGSAGDLPHGNRPAWNRDIPHALPTLCDTATRGTAASHRNGTPRGKHVSTPRTCHATWHNPQTQTEKPHASAVPSDGRQRSTPDGTRSETGTRPCALAKHLDLVPPNAPTVERTSSAEQGRQGQGLRNGFARRRSTKPRQTHKNHS